MHLPRHDFYLLARWPWTPDAATILNTRTVDKDWTSIKISHTCNNLSDFAQISILGHILRLKYVLMNLSLHNIVCL